MNAPLHRPRLLVEAELLAVRLSFLEHEERCELVAAGEDYARLDELLEEYLRIPHQRTG